jgi:hypothetical protein
MVEPVRAMGEHAAAEERRAMLLFGTAEPVVPMRSLAAGQLTAKLDRGNIRYVRWGGLEVLRAIAFVIRDTAWGTYDPAISELAIEEAAGRFSISYAARCVGPEGSFRYRAEILGSADGALTFHARGLSDEGLATNRTGFVVLHPLRGVVGRDVAVTHASGGRSTARFPDLIDPGQPVFDIKAVRHEPIPGLGVTVRMDGDTFEMEDHRNWTDASFKTYVRPLALGFPYRIEAGQVLDQRVALSVEGPAPPLPELRDGVTVSLGDAGGPMPRMGLFVPGAETALGIAERLIWLGPSCLVARVDGRGDLAELPAIAELARRVGRPLALDIIIPGKAPDAEIATVAQAIARYGLKSETTVFVAPARDLRGRAANQVPPGEAGPAEILAAARRAFSQAEIGGGMPIGFPELNRNRPPQGIDFITHATQATVHAADDVSVMETLEALPDVIRSVRSFDGVIPYRLGPATIGAPAETYSSRPARNPHNRRVTQAADDPRQRGLFAAAFALGYAAAAAEAGVDTVTLGAATGSAGVFSSDGRAYPIAAVLRGLAALAGRARIGTSIDGDGKVAALAATGDGGPVLWLGNLGEAPVEVQIKGSGFGSIWRMDAEALADHAPDEIPVAPFDSGVVKLDAYAVCRLTLG